MAQKNKNQDISMNVRNILLNIRDVIGVFAIMVLIPILAYRTAGVFIDWYGLSKEYEEVSKEFKNLTKERDKLQEQQSTYARRKEARKQLQAAQNENKDERARELQEELEFLNTQVQKIEAQKEGDMTEQQRIDELGSQIKELTTKVREKEKTLKQMQETFLRYRFYSSLGIGLIALAIGILIPLFQVGIGFLLGGIATVTYGYWIYWDFMSDFIATISIIAALVILTFGIWYYRPRYA